MKKTLHVKANVDLENRDLNPIRDSNEFQKNKRTAAGLLKPAINSDTAFVIRDPTLHLECIAAGESPEVFYAGSLHKRKILQVDTKGNFSDFTTSG